MRLRDLIKMNGPNDGTRTLFESVLPNEILVALRDWSQKVSEPVLIGGIALSYYTKPRATDDLDYLFLSDERIPPKVTKFKRVRDHAFHHEKTHVEIEVLTPSFLGISEDLVKQVYATAKVSDKVLVASPEGLVALKLQRGELQDYADIVALLKVLEINLNDWMDHLTDEQTKKFEELVMIAEKEKNGR